MSARSAEINRITNETVIQLKLTVDGRGQANVKTGIGFLDHLMTHLVVHGLLDLELIAKGDLHVDTHHTVEDCALALGAAFDQALSERRGIVRIASAYVPMDEALAFIAVDFSGRPYSVVEANWHSPLIGSLPTSLVTHFLESFASSLQAKT